MLWPASGAEPARLLGSAVLPERELDREAPPSGSATSKCGSRPRLVGGLASPVATWMVRIADAGLGDVIAKTTELRPCTSCFTATSLDKVSVKASMADRPSPRRFMWPGPQFVQQLPQRQ